MEYFFVTQEKKKREREGRVRQSSYKEMRPKLQKKLLSPALNSYLQFTQFTHMYEHKCIESDGHEQVDY